MRNYQKNLKVRWRERIAQSPSQNLNFGNISKEIRKTRHQKFVVLSSFTGFFSFVPNISQEMEARCL